MPIAPTDRVLVIGSHGVLGSLVTSAFARAGWEVLRGARRPHPGEIHVDLERPETIKAAVLASGLVVNTAPHPGLLAERTVLDRGGVAINISALPAAAGRSLRAVAGGARGTVLMNAGLAPGVTNLVAKDLLDSHPEADELEIVFTLSAKTPRGPASAEFIHRGLAALARHRTALIPLPAPFGERRCVGFGESDAGWLGGVAEGRLVRLYICVVEPELHQRMVALNDDGAMRNLLPSAIGPRHATNAEKPSREPVAHWIAALRNRRRLGARTVRCRGDFLHAARSTVAFAAALARGEPPRGCFDPEELIVLGEIEPKLRAAGVRIVPEVDPRLRDLSTSK